MQHGGLFVHGGFVAEHGGLFVHGGLGGVQGFERHVLGVHVETAVMTTGSAEQGLVAPLLLASPE